MSKKLKTDNTETVSNGKIDIVYGTGNLKDIVDSLLKNVFIKELEKENL